MKEVTISEFKAKCLGMLEEVRKTRQPIRVTRFGQPVAEIIPPSPLKPTGRLLGCMAGTAEILGDIVGATGSLADWDCLERMKFLVDTHIWLWSAVDPARLSS